MQVNKQEELSSAPMFNPESDLQSDPSARFLVFLPEASWVSFWWAIPWNNPLLSKIINKLPKACSVIALICLTRFL